MVIAKTLIKNHTQKGEQPCDVFEQVNNQLCENNKEGMFVTAWMGIIELSTSTLTYVNAGHMPPLLRKNGENYTYLHCSSGFVLAGLEGIPYQQETIQLEKGDSIYLYSDGATDAINLNEELFGEERLEQSINIYKDKTPEEILKSIKADIKRK
jgi:serine phosphatase RsbU (regulator of sigma subunit)